MKLQGTLSFAVIQILSTVFGKEVFDEFPIARECFPLKLADPNYFTCNYFISRNATNVLKSECIRELNGSPSALRIVGEFRVLKIICTASFPIDFRYYGIQPTEAIMIDYYKGLQPNSDKSTQNFTVEVRVHSVQELFEYYSKAENSYYEETDEFLPPQTVHDYSRTGRYEFHGIFNKTLGISFYLLLEDNAKPSFLQNAKTVPKYLENIFVIPCIPSHFDSDVELTEVPSSVNQRNTNIVKSPIDGFIFQSIGSKSANFYGNYKCVLKHNGVYADSINFQFKANSTEIPEKLFGLEDFNFRKGDNLDLSGEVIVQNGKAKHVKPFCKTKSLADPIDTSKLKLISIPSHNYGYMKLVQQFVIPKFFNRSYTARMVNRTTGEWNSLVVYELTQPFGTILRAGTLYCTTGYSEKIVEYAVSFRRMFITADYGYDWLQLDRKSSPARVHFGLNILNESRPLFAGTITSFACRILISDAVKPIIWYTERENGTRVEGQFSSSIDVNIYKKFSQLKNNELTVGYDILEIEKIDYDLVGNTATWNANLSVDVSKVICAASFWYSEWWKETSISFTLQEIGKPVINQVETIKTFQAGSQGVTLECTAWGNPKPNVYFEKFGQRIFSLSSENGTVLIFNEIESKNAGTYTCVASNGYETRQDFKINVKTDEFDLLAVVIPLSVFFVTVIAAAIYIKLFRPVKTGLTQEEINDFLEGMKKEQIADGDENYAHGFASMTSYKREYEIPSDRFVVDEDRVLGKGAFGIVTMGNVDNKTVAVKTTQRHAEKQYLKALLSELKIMIYLGSHPNLVQIIGAYTKDLKKGIVYVFVEYVSRGNLQSYLRNNKDLSKLPKIKDGPKQNEYVNSNHHCGPTAKSDGYKNMTPLTLHNFLQWSRQIVDGMDYLGSKKVIHGDLATRNVLLDENLVAKITDFGLSRQLYDYHDYIKKQQEPLPWRWMALESLKYMKFSTASDVWSFGITIWEIYSLGELPYPGYTWTIDFVKELDNGLRMGKPKYGSDRLFTIIRQCWHDDPKNRPSFKVLKLQLDEILSY